MLRRMLALPAMAVGVAALITFTSTPAGALTIPPLSGSVSVSDGVNGGNCYANLVEFTNSGSQSTDTYALRGTATGATIGSTDSITCSIQGGSGSFVAVPGEDTNSTGVGYSRVVQPVTATVVHVCITVHAEWSGVPPFPPGQTTISNCS